MWIVCKFILLDFRRQVFGFGPAGTWTLPVAAFAVQLLLLWFVARRGGRIWVFPQLQEALIPLLVLPVCEDLKGSTHGELQIATDKGRDADGGSFPALSHLSLLLQGSEAAAGR